MPARVPLDGFSEELFQHEGVTHTIFRRGHGPGVVIMHEMPGITPEVARFATRVADEGFTVKMPHLFGVPGKKYGVGYNLRELAVACVGKEFALLSTSGTSPMTEWLRALCRAAHAELGGKGVGALGMCITGNFALALMVDSAVMAPVLSQPSLPISVSASRRRALHVSDEALVRIKKRTAEEGVRVLGLRFTNDWMCPAERFERLRAELGEGFEGIEIDSRPGNPDGIPWYAHSVLTLHLVDKTGHPTRKALERVLAFFRERLR